MDRQKIFWVVLSVSVFVVVVLVVGVLLLRQKPAALAAAPGTVSPLSDPGTQVYEYSREAPPSGGTETMHFVIGDETPSTPKAATPPPAVQTAPPAAAPGSKSAVAVQPAVPGQKTGHAKTAAPKAAVRTGPEYWIQTGSYRSQTKAEELATLLDGKGLSGRLFSYAAGKETYFRVRIGPYANRGEAEKFLSTVKQIQGLESSYISQVAKPRTLN
jgi:cell division protein FtsN